MDVRVQDYIEDRLQSAADLDALDTLLESVNSQHVLLKKQLDEARRTQQQAREAEQKHIHSVRTQATKFQSEQADIDRRLHLITQSEASDEAVIKFETSIAKLQKLEVAAAYVELLKEVDALKRKSAVQLGVSDEAALAPYRKLQKLLDELKVRQEAAEGAATHLLDYVGAQVEEVYEAIRASFAADLKATLKKMNWPKVAETVPLALQEEWARNVTRLLDLQNMQLELRERRATAMMTNPNEEPLALLPFVVMVEALEQRFNFHFSGNKPTNRLDKPEYFLSHSTDLISQYSDFLQSAVQPLLVQQFRSSDLALTPAYIDATSAFITALLPMLKRKIDSFAKQVANQPQLLSHLVHEVIAFDTTLQDGFAYSPISAAVPWRGLAYYLLDTRDYFPAWLAAERDFALSRYRAIIDEPKSGELDFDSVGSETTTPTKAAIRVNDLLETITERYRPLASFSQKLRFLMDIQIAIFDEFHQHLRSGLEAYLTLTSALGRRVQGISKEDQDELQGVKGVDRVCRVFGSADYLERAMRDWSDDVFFLELWEELQLRAQSGGRISRNLGALKEIQQKTSAAVGNIIGNGGAFDSTVNVDEELQGGLFDETAAAYHRLRVRSETVLVETLTYNLREALRGYTRVTTWSSLSLSTSTSAPSTSPPIPTTTTAELDPLLRLLAEYFSFLARALGKAALRRIARAVCHSLQTVFWDQVLLRHSFSTAGAAQLKGDVGALVARIDGYVGVGQAQVGLRKLVQGVGLLSLPVKGAAKMGLDERKVQIEDMEDRDEDAAWDDEDNGDPDARNGAAALGDGLGRDPNGSEEEEQILGLFEVERLVFMDNESARFALQKLGLEGLSESEARAVLERRVEVTS